MNFRNKYMKKILIIGYGDIGRRLAMMCPKYQFIGVSRRRPEHLNNVEFIELDWIKDSILSLPKENISSVYNLKLVDEYKIDGDFVESQAFAFLAVRSILKLPISFPSTTGCKTPSIGGDLIKN